MKKLRARFVKKDRAKYISHLDLYRFMQRTFKRAGIDVWYTEGFNPHLYIMFPLPLSLGYESTCEVMDFNVIDDSLDCSFIMDKLNSALPDGIRITAVYEIDMKHTEIAFSEYEVQFESDDSRLSAEKFSDFMNQDQIVIQKKTKQKTMKDVDIKPFADIISFENREQGLYIKLRMPSGSNGSYNPSLLLDAFCNTAQAEPEIIKIKRTNIITSEGKNFR